MSISHKLSAAFLALVGTAHAATIDGEPTSGRLTPVTVPSYRVISQSPPQCTDDVSKKVCVTTRVLDVLDLGETHLETNPIVWKNVADARKGQSDNLEAGQMKIIVFKPSYMNLSLLFKSYIETTICPEGSKTNCIYTLSPIDGIRPISQDFE